MSTTPPVSAAQILDTRRALQREQLLAGLKAVRSGEETPVAQVVTEPPPTTTPVEPAAAPEPAQPKADPTPEPAAPPAEPVDPPGMAAVRKAEQHARRQIADERARMQAEFDSQKSAWQTRLDKAAELESKLSGARTDPLAAMAALGFTEADYEAVGRALYAASPEGRKDPNHAAAAAKALEKRSQETKMEKLERELTEFRAEQTKREKAAADQANTQRFLGSVTKAAGDKTHAKIALDRDPDAAHQRLIEIAQRLYVDSGPEGARDVPTPDEVVKAYESQRADEIKGVLAELAALGIDPATFGKPKPAVVPPPVVAPTPTAPIAAVTPATVAAPPPVPIPTAPPSRDEVLAQLAKMRSVG